MEVISCTRCHRLVEDLGYKLCNKCREYKRQRRRLREGHCVSCDKPLNPSEDYKTCSACRKAHKINRERRVKNGLCKDCNIPLSQEDLDTGRVRCINCREPHTWRPISVKPFLFKTY